jgi:hypothetical protein
MRKAHLQDSWMSALAFEESCGPPKLSVNLQRHAKTPHSRPVKHDTESKDDLDRPDLGANLILTASSYHLIMNVHCACSLALTSMKVSRDTEKEFSASLRL